MFGFSSEKTTNESGDKALLERFVRMSDDSTSESSSSGSSSEGEPRKKVFKDAIAPSPSSQPTSASWTIDALVKSAKAVLNISPSHSEAIKDVLSLPLKHQYTLLRATTERLLSKNAPTNDRNNTFESVMNILGSMGPEDKDFTRAMIKPLIFQFQDDIKKPFNNYVGHQFRTADGSFNSLLYPDVGKSGSNYIRIVNSKLPVNENLPSPKVIFDRLLKRPEGKFEQHKSGINMLLFHLGTLVTHDLFYTDSQNPERNLTTSYLDLSPLYGFNRENQESVRQMKYGLLLNDQWVDKRLVIQPPGVASLVVLFSRNHNYIAKKLLEINENEKFSYGPGKRLKSLEEQDEKLFQTARLINNGCYANIVVHDYVRTIIGTTPDSDFEFNPLSVPSDPVDGNAVSFEFNLLYRWHAALGKDDTKWITEVMSTLTESLKPSAHPGEERDLINKSVRTVGYFDMLLAEFNKIFVKASPEELEKGLPIAGAHRNLQDGTFSDMDIVGFLKKGYQQPASEMGNGLNTPAAMEHIEIAGIQQARALDMCRFNEFRQHMNLTTMATFEDFSEKVEVQKALEELYGTPDNVELYVGLMVERTKQIGLRLPYTLGRAILSDAVNLLRNDRILSKELTPTNLTNWGYQYTKGNPKLQNRVLPGMLATLFPEAVNTPVAFSQEDLRTLFHIPT